MGNEPGHILGRHQPRRLATGRAQTTRPATPEAVTTHAVKSTTDSIASLAPTSHRDDHVSDTPAPRRPTTIRLGDSVTTCASCPGSSTYNAISAGNALPSCPSHDVARASAGSDVVGGIRPTSHHRSPDPTADGVSKKSTSCYDTGDTDPHEPRHRRHVTVVNLPARSASATFGMKRAGLDDAATQRSARSFSDGYRPRSGCRAAAGGGVSRCGAAPPDEWRSPAGFSGVMSPDRTVAQTWRFNGSSLLDVGLYDAKPAAPAPENSNPRSGRRELARAPAPPLLRPPRRAPGQDE
jgi:hypothetical protein